MRTTVLTRWQTRITTAALVSATTVYIQDGSTPTPPTAPFLAIICPTNSAPEIVLVTAVNTTVRPHSLTIVRAAMGTTAVAIKADSPIYECGQKEFITGFITALGTAEVNYVPMPKCYLLRLAGVLNGALTAGAAVVTVKKNTTSLGTIDVACTGSAAGDWDELTSDGVAIGDFFFDGIDDFLHVETDGGGTGGLWRWMAEIIPY